MKISEHVRTTITQDGAVLMNIKEGQMITLNPIGSIIWQQLSDGHSPERIAGKLAAEFQIPQDQAIADVNEFLEQLEKHHLVESVESTGTRTPLGFKPMGLLCNLFGARKSAAEPSAPQSKRYSTKLDARQKDVQG
jgi:hypothetical protein